MKNIIYISVFLASCLSFGQSDILNDTILKPGIYLTVDQIANNRPINAPNLIFEKDTVNIMAHWKPKDLYVYHLKISWKQAAQTEKQGGILGFCDGKNIYLSSVYNKTTNGRSFFKAEKICHFLYYEGTNALFVDSRPHPYDNSNPYIFDIFGNSNHYMQSIVDLNKKELNIGVNNQKFKKIISDNPELLEKFKNEDDKSTVYKEYLKNYCVE